MTNKENLGAIANELRTELVIKHFEAKMAHIGSDLSCLDLLITLYFRIIGPDDRFILSKGHAALGLYSVLHKKGIMSDDVYSSLGKDGTVLGEHPIYGVSGVEVATGSLGHGLSIGAGMALAKGLSKDNGIVYVLLSDGECQEGSTLEAMNFAGRLRLDNLIAIIDSNKWQAFDRTLIDIEIIRQEFESAGWATKSIDGHDFEQIYSAITEKQDRPYLIVANTILGKGVKAIEDKLEAHYKPPNAEQIDDFISGFK